MSVNLDFDSARHLRVASISIAAYDYLITLPSEFQFFRHQWRMKRPSLAFILFVLNRYLSIATITISNIGYFAFFTDSACQQYYLISPLFKAFQVIISQVVLGVRAYAISRRSVWVGRILLCFFIIVPALEIFVNVYDRVPVNSSGICSSGNSPGNHVAFAHYLLSMIYDLLTLTISSYYLLRQAGLRTWRFSGLWRLLLIDGLGYFVLLTAANIFNLIIYNTVPTSLQSGGASLGYAVTFIMTQRILINLRNYATEVSKSHSPAVNLSSPGHRIRTKTWMEEANIEFAPQVTTRPNDNEASGDVAVHIHVNTVVDSEVQKRRDSVYSLADKEDSDSV